MTLSSILNGAMISGGLIIAIGAQNAFVLKQGLLKNHIFWVSLICFLCDFTLMSLGVLGVSGFLGRSMVLSAALSLLGGLFLLWYGLHSFRAMLSTEQSVLIVGNSDMPKSSLRQTVLATLAITLLNPHVYIDTVMLVGGVAARGVSLENLLESEVKKLPKYPLIPCVLLGRLAVDERFTGQGLGRVLLVDAIERVRRSDIAAFALMVQAKNESAKLFYEKMGFQALIDEPL
ncbi:LysE family transporter [Kingella kingae]|uniref:LysE family transporter n=1 Tax=Kingella kingae TaxID=504 RepID=UPI0003FFCDD9|nr:LysE family transporter [Kingella kingae]